MKPTAPPRAPTKKNTLNKEREQVKGEERKLHTEKFINLIVSYKGPKKKN
jgi:hypothetical protein